VTTLIHTSAFNPHIRILYPQILSVFTGIRRSACYPPAPNISWRACYPSTEQTP